MKTENDVKIEEKKNNIEQLDVMDASSEAIHH